jgi:hypothetical protein
MKGILGLAVAVAMTLGASTVANAKGLPYPYNNKAANLQAMQWYAQQQAAQGNYLYGNPYYNSSLYNGYYNNYTTPYNYGYGYSNYGVNPYYGSLPGYWY